MKIHLRKRAGRLSPQKEKKGKKQMSSLYLAYRLKPGNKTKYEWLNLHIYEAPKTNIEKDHNKETLLLAESIKARRIIDYQTSNHGFVSSVKSKTSFLNYFKMLVDKKFDESTGSHGNWLSTYHHLQTYFKGNDYSLEQIDENVLEGFKEYLFTNIKKRGVGKLNQNSALSYFNKVKAALREAYFKKYIKENPANRVKGIKEQETHRQFVTLEELTQLFKTPCDNQLLKKAFLFSALTGLRWSDVKQLTWNHFRYNEKEGWSIAYTQKKTKAAETMPISEQAVKILGERNKQQEETLFKNLNYHTWMNDQLQTWVTAAGINKKITFHCARHSFATLQLSLDTDIYTVSKLLGHKNLKTTQVYAKVLDKKKIEAVARIPDFGLI
ncbi:MAG: site-specific integrase [Bacteroidetes bacterium]|nr:site-specific integrase [Bacteroidota bacterium]